MAQSSRRVGREYALRVLYAYEMTKAPVEGIFDDRLMGRLSAKKTREFSFQLVSLYIKNVQEFDEMIRERAQNWEFSRIATIDKIILRIGICELVYFEDIPPKVTINEAIEIVKKYSTDKSGKFVNGILDAVLQDLKNAGRLNKSGRGLLDS